jgi:hypothetical protein
MESWSLILHHADYDFATGNHLLHIPLHSIRGYAMARFSWLAR